MTAEVVGLEQFEILLDPELSVSSKFKKLV
jgi:hypothetical protein